MRLIEREELLAALDRAAAGRVTIVSAPAGSGKSSLLRAWAARQDGYAYVCRNYVCHAPAAEPAALVQRLDDELGRDRGAVAPAARP